MVRKSEFITGIFILAALGVLIFVAIKPAQTTFGGGDRVTWYADFDNVALLKDRARIAVSGYDVGQVMSRETMPVEIVDPATGQSKIVLHVRVRMEVDADFAEKCCLGTTAKINQESLLGDRFVEVIPVLSGQPLEKLDDAYLIRTDPYGDWMTMLQGLKNQLGGPAEELLKALTVTADKLNNELLSKTNTDNLAEMLVRTNNVLAEAETTMKTLNNELEDPQGLLAQARAAATSGANVVGKLDRDYDEIKGGLMGTLENADGVITNANNQLNRIGKILEDADPRLQSILKTVDVQLPELITKLKQTMSDAQAMMAGIDDTVRNKDVAGLLYDSRITMQELTLTLRALRADFSQLIWGGPGVAQPAVPDPKNDLKNIQTGKPERYGY